MSKGYNKPKTEHVEKVAPIDVVCSSGISVRTKPISVKLLELFDLNHKSPEPPMMDAEAAGGVIEQVPNPDDPEYQEILKEWNRNTTSEFISLILDFGTDIELPEDDSWIKMLKRTGVKIPDDPDEKRLLYIQTFVMHNFMEDLRIIASAAMRQSGVSEEAVASWVALF